jgi:hypothetical protein
VEDAVRGIVPRTDLDVAVFAAALPPSGAKTSRVPISIRVRYPVMTGASRFDAVSDRVEYLVLAVDGRGKTAASARAAARLQLTARPGDRTAASSQPAFLLTPELALAPGPYQIRAAVTSGALQRAGSAYLDLVVPPPSGGLDVSGIVLGAPGSTVAVRDREKLLDLFGVVPTVDRAFGAKDRVVAAVRIRAPKAISIPVRASMSVIDAGGRERNRLQMEVDARGQAGARESGARDWLATVPLAALEPGRFVLRVEAVSETAPVPRAPVVREVGFQVK